MASEPVEFLTARWVELERWARTCQLAYPSPWELSDRGWIAKVTADEPAFRIVVELDQQHAPQTDGGWLGDYLQHIAANDPAYVLADIAAKRAILALHTSTTGRPGGDCETCGTPVEYYITWPCDTVRYLLLPFADHPDYDQAWRL